VDGGVIHKGYAPGSTECPQYLVIPHTDNIPTAHSRQKTVGIHEKMSVVWGNAERMLREVQRKYPDCFPPVCYIDGAAQGERPATKERLLGIARVRAEERRGMVDLAAAVCDAQGEDRARAMRTLVTKAGFGPMTPFLLDGSMELRGCEDRGLLASAMNLRWQFDALERSGATYQNSAEYRSLYAQLLANDQDRDVAIHKYVTAQEDPMPLIVMGLAHGPNIQRLLQQQEGQSYMLWQPDGIEEYLAAAEDPSPSLVATRISD
jgi:hypothetical protein